MKSEAEKINQKLNEKLFYFYNNGGPMMDVKPVTRAQRPKVSKSPYIEKGPSIAKIA